MLDFISKMGNIIDSISNTFSTFSNSIPDFLKWAFLVALAVFIVKLILDLL